MLLEAKNESRWNLAQEQRKTVKRTVPKHKTMMTWSDLFDEMLAIYNRDKMRNFGMGRNLKTEKKTMNWKVLN